MPLPECLHIKTVKPCGGYRKSILDCDNLSLPNVEEFLVLKLPYSERGDYSGELALGYQKNMHSENGAFRMIHREYS